ncbi:MAG TPA: hypothetical protein VGJ03_09915 [Acidimicrobiales bacterium]
MTVPVEGASAPAPPMTVPPSPEEEAVITATNRQAACMALAAAAFGILGAFQVWVNITIAGFSPPGSTQSGWDGGDGRTIVVAGGVAIVGAAALLIGRRDLWVKVVLLIAGATTGIIAIVNMVDAGSKAHDIQVQFGIPSGDVHAQIGIGLFMVVICGIVLLAAGLRMRTASQ